MSKEKTSTARVANSGEWKLSYSTTRSTRISDFREFKEDCIASHEEKCGAAAGPVLKLGQVTLKQAPIPPIIPMGADFEEEEDKERKYQAAMLVFKGEEATYYQACKSAQTHKDKCYDDVLPKLFVWILGRLVQDLRSRVEQESRFALLETARPRDPVALMDLIESVMIKGDMDDEGYDDFVALKDIFCAPPMKDAQALSEGVRIYKDKMAHFQSKPAYQRTVQDELGQSTTQSVFTEEFFVHLMFHNLPKKFDEAKVAYTNQVTSEAIKRCKTFDALGKYFSSVRNVTTGDTVSATALTTVKDKKGSTGKKSKGGTGKSSGADKPKPAKRVFKPGTHRKCRHCKGDHFDDLCPSPKKPVNASTDPSQDEIAKVLEHLRQKKADKEAKALAASAKKLTAEDIEDALEEYASTRI